MPAPTPHEAVEIIGGLLMILAVVTFFVAVVFRWMAARGYLLGNIAYPMGKRALDPRLNREARERDLAIGRRRARRLWGLRPLFAAMFVAGPAALVVAAVT